MSPKIGVVINYCTNDYKFIKPNINQVALIGPKEIIVTYTDHFYNGEREDLALIKKTIKENPKARFVEIKYYPVKPPFNEFFLRLIPRSFNLRPLYGPHYWACMARYTGYRQLSEKVDYVLFLDADEIIDGERFRQWLETNEYQKLGGMIFACYLYFRKPIYRAKTWEECGLLVKNYKIKKGDFLSHNDRRNIYRKAPSPKKSFILGIDGQPMIHHYAWARNKKEMLKKVKTWGHSQERNWEKLVLEEFSRPFNGTDFLRHYKYEKVTPFISFDNKDE